MAKDTPKYSTNKQLHIPKSIARYKARKLQTFIRLMDQRIERDPASIDPVKYVKVLEEFDRVMEEVKKEESDSGMDKVMVDTQVSEAEETSIFEE